MVEVKYHRSAATAREFLNLITEIESRTSVYLLISHIILRRWVEWMQ